MHLTSVGGGGGGWANICNIRKRRFSVDNLVIGVQLADVSTRCSSHPQGKGPEDD